MADDDFLNIQRGIEKDLFDEHNKMLDRFYSLISLMFAASGFSLTVITFVIGKGVETVQMAFGDYHVQLCFISLFLAFIISILNVLSLTHHRRLVKKDGSMGYREGDELVINNVKISRDLTKQKDQYTIAITFIAVSLISLFNSFASHPIRNKMLTVGFILMVRCQYANLVKRGIKTDRLCSNATQSKGYRGAGEKKNLLLINLIVPILKIAL